MKTNSTQIRIGAAIIIWSFLLIVGSSLSPAVQAQYRNNDVQGRRDDRNRNGRGGNGDNYGNYGGSFDLRQTALNAGYNEGLKDGASARQRGRGSDYQNQSVYRRATKDYSSRLGDRELYRRYFREAYENGYNNGLNPGSYDNNGNRDWNRNNNRDWNRGDNRDQNQRGRTGDGYDNWGGSFDLRQTALNAGYNEGIKDGRNDRNRNGRSDFRNKSAYQKATSDYSSKLGDRGLYQRYYRAAYENGYSTGLDGN